MNFRRHLFRGAASGLWHLCLQAALIISIWSGPVQCSCQAPDPESVLRQRVESFWGAMQKADYEAAAGFVHPDSRSYFIYKQRKSGVISWNIQSLRFSDDGAACDVTVLVVHPFPMVSDVKEPIHWPTKDRWVVMADSQWYIKLPTGAGSNPFLEMYKQSVASGNGLKAEIPAGAAGKTAPPPVAPQPKPRQLAPDPANPQWLHRGERGVFRYRYENSGTAPARIVSAIVDGSHITFNGINVDVPPGQTGALEIVVDTFGLPDGPIQKVVNIQFSDLAEPMAVVVRTESRPNFILSPAAVDFGSLTKGIATEKTVRILNQSGKKVKFLSVRNSEPQLTVISDGTEINPGEELLVTIRCQPSVEGGISDSIVLRTDLESEALINVLVRGRIGR
jgi:hypothetical protein